MPMPGSQTAFNTLAMAMSPWATGLTAGIGMTSTGVTIAPAKVASPIAAKPQLS